MYFAIDNIKKTVIGLHNNHEVICNLAWIHDHSPRAQIIIAPVGDLLTLNELSSETISDILKEYDEPEVKDRFENLENLNSLLSYMEPTKVNVARLEIEAAKII